jgi:hypothetical protein
VIGDSWNIIVLDLPNFGPDYVWVTVSRRCAQEAIEQYRSRPTPDGVTVTAGGAVPSRRAQLPGRGLTRRDAQLVCEAVGVQLGAEGLRVLSDARRMARKRRLAQGAAASATATVMRSCADPQRPAARATPSAPPPAGAG